MGIPSCSSARSEPVRMQASEQAWAAVDWLRYPKPWLRRAVLVTIHSNRTTPNTPVVHAYRHGLMAPTQHIAAPRSAEREVVLC